MFLQICYRIMTKGLLVAAFCGVAFTALPVFADATLDVEPYRVQPGDVLQVGVWREADLSLEVVVRPDGGFSLPLLGEVVAAGRSIADLRTELLSRYHRLIPDTDVFVAVRQLAGNKIYVIGRVSRPGEFVINRTVDIMQALSIAGGATPFADTGNIKVLRRTRDQQQVFNFDYGMVEQGQQLEQNILLQSGDIVVVP